MIRVPCVLRSACVLVLGIVQTKELLSMSAQSRVISQTGEGERKEHQHHVLQDTAELRKHSRPELSQDIKVLTPGLEC